MGGWVGRWPYYVTIYLVQNMFFSPLVLQGYYFYCSSSTIFIEYG